MCYTRVFEEAHSTFITAIKRIPQRENGTLRENCTAMFHPSNRIANAAFFSTKGK